MARPAEDIALYRADMEQWVDKPDQTEWEEDVRDWMAANEACRRDILSMLRSDGPLPASEFPDTTVVPWRSSGWNNDRNVRMMLDVMAANERGHFQGGPPRKAEGTARIWNNPCSLDIYWQGGNINFRTPLAAQDPASKFQQREKDLHLEK
jgi:hypothetical protein